LGKDPVAGNIHASAVSGIDISYQTLPLYSERAEDGTIRTNAYTLH